MTASPGRSPSEYLAAVILLVPALAAAGYLTWAEMLNDPSSQQPSAEMSFVDALREDRFLRAFAYIREGQDPNAPVPFTDPQLTGGQPVAATPLLIAVALDRADSVKMLMSSGATLTAPGSRYATCLAVRLGYGRLVDVMVRQGGPDAAGAACPDQPHPETAPLIAYAN